MKQETINIIKSMTEQGFLVIVDPEKLKGEGAVMIEVMNWKENNNGVKISSTANDQKINAEIAELAGFKKEEPKPEIDLLQCDGRRFRAKINEIECEGVVSVEQGELFFCQNTQGGAEADDMKGFNFSWRVCPPFTIKNLHGWGVTDFELLPEPRVIFTNCVGEVFTEEDVWNDMVVWHYQSNTNKLYSTRFSRIDVTEVYKASDTATDIFRSKKSLLKYLYETCE